MQIRRNGMGYVSKKILRKQKKLGTLLCSAAYIGGEVGLPLNFKEM